MKSAARRSGRTAGRLIVAGIFMLLLFLEELHHRQWLPAILCGIMAIVLLLLPMTLRPHSHHDRARQPVRYFLFVAGALVCMLVLLVFFFHHQQA